MLPVLLFESLWKLLWLALVAVPAWAFGWLDDTTREGTTEVLLVVIILAVIPWRFVVRRYVTAPGDRWRGSVTPAQWRGDPARR